MLPMIRPASSKQANLCSDSIGQGKPMSFLAAQFAQPFVINELLPIAAPYSSLNAEEV
jgi:hypothetical protein